MKNKYKPPRKFIVKVSGQYGDATFQRGYVLVMKKYLGGYSYYKDKAPLDSNTKCNVYSLDTDTVQRAEEMGWIIRLK